MSVFLQKALRYAASGWSVFPCQPKTKIPATPHGFKDATTDPARIRAWWDEEPAYNVAIATGEVSGLFVLDVDEKPGRTVEEAVELLPKIPDCPTVRTGGGGRQFFFKFPVGSGLSISGGRLGLGVDTRGNGGYVVAPPSIHNKTERTYEWIDSDDVTLPECPQWIVDRLAKQTRGAVQLASERISGGRHDALMTAAALMRSSGFVPAEIEAALFKVRDRLDLSDGRVIEDREIQNIAQWCGDKGVGDVNIESVMHGKECARSLAQARGGALAEMISEPGISDPGPFPPELLNVPGIVNEWTAHADRTCNKRQPEMALGSVLAACGAVIGRRLMTSDRNRANLYCLGLCGSGGGKENTRQIIKNVLMASYHGRGGERAKKILGPEDLASDAGLITSLVADPVRLFQLDEFGKMLEMLSAPRAPAHLAAIVQTLLRLYTAAQSMYLGKAYASGENPEIDRPHACIYGTGIPEQTWQALGSKSAVDGMLARLLIFQATDNLPPTIDRTEIEDPPAALVDRISDWLQAVDATAHSKGPTAIVPYTSEAKSLLREFQEECDGMILQMGGHPLGVLWTRANQKARQLSLIHAWSDAWWKGQPVAAIGYESAAWGRKLSDYLTRSMVWHANRNLAGSSSESDLKTVLRYVEEGGRKGRTKRDLVRRFQRLGTRGLEEVFLLALAGEQVVKQLHVSEGTHKPTTTYYLPHLAPVMMDPAEE